LDAADMDASAEELAEQGTDAEPLQAEPGPAVESEGESREPVDELAFEPEVAEAEQFGTIDDAGSPTHNQPEGAGPEVTPEKDHGV
jgi:hypothetical protein